MSGNSQILMEDPVLTTLIGTHVGKNNLFNFYLLIGRIRYFIEFNISVVAQILILVDNCASFSWAHAFTSSFLFGQEVLLPQPSHMS